KGSPGHGPDHTSGPITPTRPRAAQSAGPFWRLRLIAISLAENLVTAVPGRARWAPRSGPRTGLLVLRDRPRGCGRTEHVGEDIDAGVDAVLETVVEPGLEQAFLRGEHLAGACGDRAEQSERRRAQLPRLDHAVDQALGSELGDRVKVAGEDDLFGLGQAD